MLMTPNTHSIGGFGPVLCIFSDVEVPFLFHYVTMTVGYSGHNESLTHTRGEFEHRTVKTQLIIVDKTIIFKY